MKWADVRVACNQCSMTCIFVTNRLIKYAIHLKSWALTPQSNKAEGQRYLFRNQMILASASRHSLAPNAPSFSSSTGCDDWCWIFPFLLWISRNICANKQPKHAYVQFFLLFSFSFVFPYTFFYLPGWFDFESCGYYVLLVRSFFFFFSCAARKMKLKKKINHHFFFRISSCFLFFFFFFLLFAFIFHRSHSLGVCTRANIQFYGKKFNQLFYKSKRAKEQ